MSALGHHTLLDFYGCAARRVRRSRDIKALLCAAVCAGGGRIVKAVFHNFSPYGVSGVVVITESHVTIHTWPEHGFVTIDVYVCNYTTDNTYKAERLFRSMQEALRPQRTKYQAIHRGGSDA